MNKTAIKNYAIWARVQLIESAKQRAYEYEITENGENNPNLEAIGGRLLSKVEKEQDFSEVRGEFASNSFVSAVQEHIRVKGALGDELIARLKKS